jgi:SAM-dependent methyltransferase
MRLSPRVDTRPWGDGLLLWNRATGRSLQVHPASLETPSEALLRRLDDLDMVGTPDLASRVVCRSRLVLCLPEIPALWLPVPQAHSSGGYGYRMLPLSDEELLTWRAINDARSLDQLPGSTTFLTALMTLDTQAVQLRRSPPRRQDPGLRRLVSPPRPAHERTPDQRDKDGTTLGTYHRDHIVDAQTQFDDRETTVAHAMELPHPGLAHRPYGEALFQAIGTTPQFVVEVGCGTGAVAAAWPHPEVPYLRIDLSPTLLSAQSRRAPETLAVLGDAVRLPLKDACVDLLVSNEVLADLRSEAREDGWHNVGSWQFVDEVARVLAPGGTALLTEFGTLDQPPQEAVQLDHPEVSIHFGELARRAEKQGLSAELIRLDAFLSMDLRASQLSRHSWQALRALARSRSVHLEARAWTPRTLTLPWAVEGLEWTTLMDEGPGPLVTRFWACLMRKPPVD